MGGTGPPACALANEPAVGASRLDETEADARDLVLVFVFVPAAVLPVLLISMLPTPEAALSTLVKIPPVPRDDTKPQKSSNYSSLRTADPQSRSQDGN
jgi:hypothetical protein